MALITLGSVRSCGVTTLAIGLAATWPGDRRRLLVEADPAGGTLAAQAGLGPEPGLVSLAAAARRRGDPFLAFEHVQHVTGDVPVVCGPPASSRARSALSMLPGLLGRLGDLDAEVFCDCGRLDRTTDNVDLFERGQLAVFVSRPRLSDLNALAAHLEEGAEQGRRVFLVLVGDGPYPANEVAEVLGVDVAGQVPWDADAAAAIGTAPISSRQLTRTPLVRALRSLVGALAERLAHEEAAASAEPSADGITPLAEVQP